MSWSRGYQPFPNSFANSASDFSDRTGTRCLSVWIGRDYVAAKNSLTVEESFRNSLREPDVYSNVVQGFSVPLVVRLEGTNVEKGRKLLAESGLAILAADDLTDAAVKVIALAKDKDATS